MGERWRLLVAEVFGTAVLVMGGVGSAVLATSEPLSIGTYGVSLAFGLSLLVMVYAIGNISGCHINPAVTIGLWLMRKTAARDVPFYLIGQLVGAAAGAIIIFLIANGVEGFDPTNNFAQNGFEEFSPGGYSLAATALAEMVFTALLVFVIASTLHPKFPAAGAGLAIGLSLTLIHLISIPIDNTSVNPARSFASAIFAGADAWKQLWVFIVFPLVGGLLGAYAWMTIHKQSAS
ncbi:MAG: Aquaporin Z [Acidimicrobiales bacterium]|nr:MAG: aquaporin Z [Actinomycetota bacterium]MBV6509882.1 Aquaporin Z [Acidimicrobiales bacterium]RIK06181.1 MAG: aquaporin Z [Acidobacteriota bacterium]